MAKGKNLRRLAEVLNCRAGWLLGEEDHVAADVLSKAGTAYGKDTWQQRALAAEKKLADLRSGIRLLLEMSADAPHPRRRLAAGAVTDLSAAEALKRTEGLEKPRAQ